MNERRQAEDAPDSTMSGEADGGSAGEQWFETLFNSVDDAIFIHDCETGDILDVNARVVEIFGYTREEARRLSIRDLSANDETYTEETARVMLRKAAAGEPQLFEWHARDRAGRLFWTEGNLRRATIGGKDYLLLTGREITGRKRTEAALQESLDRLRASMEGVIDAIVTISSIRDPYTAGHQKQVAQLAGAIAGEMGLSADTVECIRTAAVLHDIGKIYVPAEILSRPGLLTIVEREFIKSHVQASADILKTIEFPWPVARIALQHHERCDGSGYPYGIRKDDILPEARVLAVADVVEAMLHHRPYRPALGVNETLAEIMMHRGRAYDPGAVDACVRLFREKGFSFGAPGGS